ncbi:glycine betaine ABC transporter substrate-binding protein [Chromobacterium sphagni]|uniref:glycine betaine ABC transporter substrate-binding protein n=1 Tax=Chromobacterium sphagni TaxID=1903179 RepID=UPI0019D40033|nr:glycine betaine ABC transporter substrate-binding protein [Chromobacterium sphagni]
MPLWQPQFLHWQHDIRELADPAGLLRGKDEATLLIRKAALERLPASAAAELHALRLGNRALTWLDHLVSRRGLAPRHAARQWLQPPS